MADAHYTGTSKNVFFHDSRDSTMLEDPKQLRWGKLSSGIYKYTMVPRAVLPYSREKITISRVTLLKIMR
jgi:hypothetical protein